MMNVFVYGSLLFPEITKGLCGQKVKIEDAVLEGYKRYALKGADYPAIIPKKNSTVNGRVLLNLNEKTIELLAFYESDEYKISPVKVKTNSGILNAIVFVWIAGNEFFKDFDWNKEQFELESLEFYRDEIIPATLKEYYDQI